MTLRSLWHKKISLRQLKGVQLLFKKAMWQGMKNGSSSLDHTRSILVTILYLKDKIWYSRTFEYVKTKIHSVPTQISCRCGGWSEANNWMKSDNWAKMTLRSRWHKKTSLQQLKGVPLLCKRAMWQGIKNGSSSLDHTSSILVTIPYLKSKIWCWSTLEGKVQFPLL